MGLTYLQWVAQEVLNLPKTFVPHVVLISMSLVIFAMSFRCSLILAICICLLLDLFVLNLMILLI